MVIVLSQDVHPDQQTWCHCISKCFGLFTLCLFIFYRSHHRTELGKRKKKLENQEPTEAKKRGCENYGLTCRKRQRY